MKLEVERWPHRKRKVLSAVGEGSSTALAVFQSDDAADLFLKLANEAIMTAYMMGRSHAARAS